MTTARKTTAKKTVKEATKPAASVSKATKAAKSQPASAENFFNTAQEQMTKLVSDFNTQTEAMRDNSVDFSEMVRERIETAQAQAQATSTDLMNAARDEISDAVQFTNDLAQARNFSDALEIQRDYWTNLFDTRMQRARDLSDASTEFTRETVESASDKFEDAMKNSAFADFSFEKFMPFQMKA